MEDRFLSVTAELLTRIRAELARHEFGAKIAARRRELIRLPIFRALRSYQDGQTSYNVLGWQPPYVAGDYEVLDETKDVRLYAAFGDMAILLVQYLTFRGREREAFVLIDQSGAVRAASNDYRRVSKVAHEILPAERERGRQWREYGPTVWKFRAMSGMPDANKVPLGIVVDWADEFGNPTDEERGILYEAREKNAKL